VFENRMLRRIFGPKREEVTEAWRKYLNKEFKLVAILCAEETNNCVVYRKYDISISGTSG
jgi:hypothetical protein